ncbi:SDR family oxidoreductase [Ensifer sp. 1H6]|uniref:SDR family NAD(P)-dependent oxidoreductase n=1 Tax=Ensifer sp. 1H6 TaxID=1911585 RepID=UPI00042E7225|nr:SDR family oxidoreductase [Ensifer sp. 1H6]AHK46750.1 putative short-chain dehydrogenase [Ensifer adhaerens OV14]OMQ46366.1 short-chain dehydrogenase [Ensifer sp. 1H6]
MQETLGKAVITGASSGIGALYADRLARKGYDLILVARNGDRLWRAAATIHEQTGRTVETVTADLTVADDVARVAAQIAGDPRITMLVNNAGVGATAPLLQSDAHAMSAMIALNVDALMRLTYAAVPAFVERNRGTIINIASIVAVAPERLNGVYGGTKAFVLAFSQSLRQELADSNVHVQVVLPGATATDFWDIAGLPVQHLPQEIVMPADALVDAALMGLARNEFVTIPSLHDVGQWDTFEAARQAMADNLSTNKPADRYLAN